METTGKQNNDLNLPHDTVDSRDILNSMYLYLEITQKKFDQGFYHLSLERYEFTLQYLISYAENYIDEQSYDEFYTFLCQRIDETKRLINDGENSNQLIVEEDDEFTLPFDSTDPLEIDNSICHYILITEIKFKRGEFILSLERYEFALQYLINHGKKYLSQEAYEELYTFLYDDIQKTKSHIGATIDPIEKFMSVPIFRIVLRPLELIGYNRYFKFIKLYTSNILARLLLMLIGVTVPILIAGMIFRFSLKFLSPLSFIISLLGHFFCIVSFIILFENFTSLLEKKMESNISAVLSAIFSQAIFLAIYFSLRSNNLIIPTGIWNVSVYLLSLFVALVIISRGFMAIRSPRKNN